MWKWHLGHRSSGPRGDVYIAALTATLERSDPALTKWCRAAMAAMLDNKTLSGLTWRRSPFTDVPLRALARDLAADWRFSLRVRWFALVLAPWCRLRRLVRAVRALRLPRRAQVRAYARKHWQGIATCVVVVLLACWCYFVFTTSSA